MSFSHVLLWIEHYSIVVVFVVFSMVLATTYWPGRKTSLEDKARLLLDDDR